MTETRASQLPLDAAFVILVYPFEHDLDGSHRLQRLELLDPYWRPWLYRLDEAARAVALDDTYFFLPYVRELLFPETTRLPGRDPSGQLAEADWTLTERLPQFAAQLAPTAVLRLTYDPQRLKALLPLRLVLDAEDQAERFDAPFGVDWADAILFPQNTGFLALKVRLLEPKPTVGRWNDFLYQLRLIHPPRLDWQLATWQVKDGRLTGTSRDLVEFFLQGLTHGDQLRPDLEEFLPYITQSEDRARYTATPHGQVYGGVFHLFVYGCFDDSAARVTPAEPDPAAGIFSSISERALYELATCTSTEDPDYVPHRSQVEALARDNLIALWDCWQGLALRDNVVFLGTSPRGFARHALPANVESDYFHLYLLVLFQKTRVSELFEDLVRKEDDLAANLRDVRRLWDEFVVFQNLYWYQEVTRKPQGTALYRRFQQGLDVLPHYEEAVEQSRELKAYYEGKAQRRTNSLLLFLTIIGMPVQMLVNLIVGQLFKLENWWELAVMLVGLPLLLYGLWRSWELIRRD